MKKKAGAEATPDISVLKAKALVVHERLLATYGERPLKPRRDPMHELISTILSHRTNAANENRAYQNLWERFGSWEAMRAAPLDALIEAISPATFPDVKAPYIKQALTYIHAQRGEFSIDFLGDLSAEDGLKWLMATPGVGIKTATLVLLFCFGKPVMPVDTHVHRVAGRIGLIGPKVNPTAAHPILLALLPPDPPLLYNFHINNLRHGQKVCVFGTPHCERCPLTDLCNWYQANRASRPAASEEV